MSQRRMFSAEIVESDAFLDMPSSSQALYFHLCMSADDDGFVNPKKIMRMIGVADDDLKVIISKRFVLPFENGVVVIKHWLIHNMIRKDRYKATQYVEQKALLKLKSNNSYTEWQPNGNQMTPQVRLGKVRLGKITTCSSTMSVADFETFWLTYPKHKNKQNAQKKFLKLDNALLPQIISAIEKQKMTDQWNKDKGQFIPYPDTWINGKRWEDEVEQPKTLSLEQEAKKLLKECIDQYGDEKGGNIAYFRFDKKFGSEAGLKYINLFGAI